MAAEESEEVAEEAEEETEEAAEEAEDEAEETAEEAEEIILEEEPEASGEETGDDPEEAAEPTEEAAQPTAQTAAGEGYRVKVDAPAASGIPAGAELYARELTGAEAEPYYAQAQEALGRLAYARFIDIGFTHEGEEIEPEGDVRVAIDLDDLWGVVLTIRQKKAMHKKLEKHEQEFFAANRDLCSVEFASDRQSPEDQMREIYESLLRNGGDIDG